MKRLRVGDIELSVEERGRGLPLLLVHGFPFDHSMWQAQLDDLASDFHVVAPDLRGFGRSQVTPGKVTMERFADDLAALLDEMRVTQGIVFCGFSMGGYVAWQFWRRHAHRLRALILCDTRAMADTDEVARGRLVSAEQVVSSGPASLVEAMVPRLFAERTLREQVELVEATRRIMMSTAREGIAAALRGMAERPDVSADLPKITVPAICVCGEHDVISRAGEMRDMAAAMPHGEFREIADAGHMAPREQPAAVNAALRGFLKQLS